MRLNLSLVSTLMCVLLLCGGTACQNDDPRTEDPEKPSAQATPPMPKDSAWEEVQALLSNPDETVHTKKRRLERYIQNNPGSPHLPEARKRLAVLQKEVERDLARQQERARAAKDKLKAQEEAKAAESEEHTKAILAAGVPALAVRGLAYAADWNPDKRVQQFDPVVLTIDGKEYRFAHPMRGSIGTFIGGASDLVYHDLKTIKSELKAEFPEWRIRRRALVNRLLREHMGGDIFPMDTPGALNKAPLKALIAAMKLSPTDTVLGHKASTLYRLVRSSLVDHARIYQEMHSRLGRRKVLAAYKAALSTEATTYEGDMRTFYRSYTETHKLESKTDGWYGTPVIVGFWMRRMADGTDTLIYTALHNTARTFDPALGKQLKL
ncbi:MAG: hypothetical protein AAFS10_04350 [Myxococcota bacterium]